MPHLAIYDGEEKTANQVPKQVDVECPECGGRMRVWSRSSDGRVRHFKHVEGMGHGQGGSGSSCESVAESDKHKVWKSFAVDALMAAFSGKVDGWKGFSEDKKRDLLLEKGLEAPTSEKKWRVGDVVLTFDSRDDQLGHGIIVEVQHKNENKDISLTTADYIGQDYSVVWLYSDDFTDDRCTLNELDFRYRARQAAIDAVWPEILPGPNQWQSEKQDFRNIEQRWCEAYQSGLCERGTDAIIPSEWFDKKALDIWRDQYWYNLFRRHRETFSTRGYDTDTYIGEVRESVSGSVEVPATLPKEWYDFIARSLWNSHEWSELFGGYESREYLAQVRKNQDLPTLSVNFWSIYPKTVIKQWFEQGRQQRLEAIDSVPDHDSWTGVFDYRPPNSGPDIEVKIPIEYFEEHREDLEQCWKYGAGKLEWDLVRRMSRNNAPRRCRSCGDSADYYLIKNDFKSIYFCEEHAKIVAPDDVSSSNTQ